jgi:hypothetical protein
MGKKILQEITEGTEREAKEVRIMIMTRKDSNGRKFLQEMFSVLESAFS